MDDDRPAIRCVIAWPLRGGDVILSKQDTVSLEDAVSYKRMGWLVLVDPADESDLATWEREHRWMVLRRWL